ncbi:hypothetical protein BGZ73_007008 [Actinomortierella ambigua]|nr:hypothetical protein BGZ73_007008 [Actinomortierella ambigua]
MAVIDFNVLLAGNAGAGKSYLLNSIGGNFKSGFSAVDGLTTDSTYCDVNISGSTVRLIDVPGLLEATDENVARNAKAITKALGMNGGFKLIFVLAEGSGRVTSSDLYMIGTVMSGVEFAINVGLIVNKVPEEDMERYGEGSTRNSILASLNGAASGKILSSWFFVIPRYPRSNPNGPRACFIDMLTQMTVQSIPKVVPIKASVKEHSKFVTFMMNVADTAEDLWQRFMDWLWL